MKYIFFFVISLLVTSPFLSIGWFTIWAWLALSNLIAFAYDSFCVSQENNAKIAQALLDKMGKFEQQCTRMSTIMGEIRDNAHPKKRFDSNKFKKNNNG